MWNVDSCVIQVVMTYKSVMTLHFLVTSVLVRTPSSKIETNNAPSPPIFAAPGRAEVDNPQ